MTGPELQRILHLVTPASGAAIDFTFRALRATRLHPISPRGRGSLPVEMRPEHAAVALLALAIDREPTKAAEVIPAWRDMRPRDDDSDAATTFGDTLTQILTDTTFSRRTREVRICREWPRASILSGDLAKPETVTFGIVTPAEARAAGFRVTVCRSEYVLSGGALQQIAIELASPDGGMFGAVAEIVADEESVQ